MSGNPVSIHEVQAGKQIAAPKAMQAMDAMSPFSSLTAFEAAQRMAAALNASTMIPKQYQGRDNIGNALIAMEIAYRNGSSVFAVMQELYVVHNKPSWSSKYLIATINQSGKFSEPLQYEFCGTEGQDDWGCRAITFSKSGNLIDGPWVTIKIAKAEGWYQKSGSKWQTMPGLMLRYRAASQFCNTVCPELALGMKTVEEAQDILDVDTNTGEILNRPTRTITPAQAGGATIPPIQGAASDSCDDLPWGAAAGDAAVAAEISDPGYTTVLGQDGSTTYTNRHGEQWNPEIHATSSTDLGPIVNSDGHFRARRGVSPAVVAAVQQQAPAQAVQQQAPGNYDIE